MHRLLFSIILISFFSGLFGQADKTSIWIKEIQLDGISAANGFLRECKTEIAEAFIKHGAFSIVDREYSGLIDDERELQKSESFMDGKFVEQGKAIGAEYILSGKYISKDKKLELTAISVATGNVVATEEQSVDPTPPTKYYKKQIRKLSFKMSNLLAGANKVTVVRSIEDKGKESRVLLIAGGVAKGFQEGMDIEVFQIQKEEVEGELLERFAPVGKAKISRVENANFSNAKIKAGGKEMFQLLASGQKLYARAMIK